MEDNKIKKVKMNFLIIHQFLLKKYKTNMGRIIYR